MGVLITGKNNEGEVIFGNWASVTPCMENVKFAEQSALEKSSKMY